MDMAAPQWLVALEASGLGAAIRQSVWLYPAANVGHVLAVVGFVSAVVVMDLGLLGVLALRGRAALLASARRWAMGGLGAAVATGAILFIAEASHVALNRVFQIKMVLIGVGLAHALVSGQRGLAAASALADHEPLPAAVRRTAMLSVAIWFVVAGLGRFIAYV